MIGRETDTMDAAIADGNGLIARVRSESAAIRAELAAAPDVATPLAELRVSPELRERYATLQRVAAAADGLDRPWARLETGGAAAGLLAAQLAEHDRLVGVAADQGRQAKYKEAIATIDSAAAILKAAHALARPAREHRRRQHARPVARAERDLRPGAAGALQADPERRQAGHQGAEGRDRGREGRAGPSAARTRGAWS